MNDAAPGAPASPRPGRRSILIAAVAVGLLGGCAAPMSSALLARRPADLPPRVDLDGTPFFPQTIHQCGPAALATVLTAAGFDADPDRLAAQVYLPAREGSLQIEMLAAARRAGAVAVRLPPTVDALLHEVAGGHPVALLQNLGLAIAPRWHYAALVGYDLDASEAILRSGTTRRETLSLSTLEHTWARGEHWAFVALPPGQLPVTATEAAVGDALIGHERQARPEQAARAYAAALQRWPASLTFAIGLGNSRAAAGDAAGAAAAFEQAARRHDSAAAWSNLARMRLELGQHAAARDAAERALARATSGEPQWLEAARATWTEVNR